MANTGLSLNTILMAPTLPIRGAQKENMTRELSAPLTRKQNHLEDEIKEYIPKQVRKCKQRAGNNSTVFPYSILTMHMCSISFSNLCSKH